MADSKIIVRTSISAPLASVWRAYTSPDEITHWNFASDDWCCPSANVNLQVGGTFSSRMEAKDGSMGFDFEGVYTKVEEPHLLEFSFGDRVATVSFTSEPEGTLAQIVFDPETDNPVDFQRQGWQSILNNFGKYVESKQ